MTTKYRKFDAFSRIITVIFRFVLLYMYLPMQVQVGSLSFSSLQNSAEEQKPSQGLAQILPPSYMFSDRSFENSLNWQNTQNYEINIFLPNYLNIEDTIFACVIRFDRKTIIIKL